MSRRREQYITVPVRGGIRKLSVSDILFVEVQDHDLLFHTRQENILTRGSLAELEAKLSDSGFFRCNKYCLVNLSFVESLQCIDLVVARAYSGQPSKEKGHAGYPEQLSQ